MTAFTAACDALRAKLREVEDEGWVPVEVRDEASRDASAAGQSSLGLAALRIVLQHVCQADQAVLTIVVSVVMALTVGIIQIFAAHQGMHNGLSSHLG